MHARGGEVVFGESTRRELRLCFSLVPPRARMQRSFVLWKLWVLGVDHGGTNVHARKGIARTATVLKTRVLRDSEAPVQEVHDDRGRDSRNADKLPPRVAWRPGR